MSVGRKRLLLVLGIALSAALVTLVLAIEYKGRMRGGVGGQFTVAVFGCGDREVLERLIARAVKHVNLTGVRIVVGRPVEADIVVINVTACVVNARERDHALEIFAGTLVRGGVAILVGSPRLVSAFIKMQHRVLMAYPLPAINETIVYALHVAKVSSTTAVSGSVGYIVAPEVAYWKGVTVASLASAFEFAVSRLEGTRR